MAYVWQINMIDLGEETFVNGTILRNKPKSKYNARSIVENLFQVVLSYGNFAYKKRNIYLIINNQEYQIKTDKNGYFEVTVPETLSDNFYILNRKKKKMEMIQDYPSQFYQKKPKYEVISDIDDTLIHSNTVSLFKRLSTLLLLRAKKRRSVDATVELLQEFDKHQFRITYLSKSESNLFRLIYNIFKINNLPKGAMLLSPYLSFKRLILSKMDNFKIDHLKRLITKLPDKKFILLGDDTQQDIHIYTSIAQQFNAQIEKVYIRQSNAFINVADTVAWKELLDTGVTCQIIAFEDELKDEIDNFSTT